MYAASIIGALVASILTRTISAHPYILKFGPRDGYAGQCIMTHFPTEEAYRQGLAQYCDDHVKDGISLNNMEELVITVTLEDRSGYPIKWIYKIRWEDHSNGEGSINITRDMCFDKFNGWAEGDTQGGLGKAYCMDGDTKLVMGGKYIGGGSSGGNKPARPGSELWIETRQRIDDKFVPPHAARGMTTGRTSANISEVRQNILRR